MPIDREILAQASGRMGRTACNVTGDLAVTCVVARTENEMDVSAWQQEPKDQEVMATAEA